MRGGTPVLLSVGLAAVVAVVVVLRHTTHRPSDQAAVCQPSSAPSFAPAPTTPSDPTPAPVDPTVPRLLRAPLAASLPADVAVVATAHPTDVRPQGLVQLSSTLINASANGRLSMPSTARR
jgi:hypothetical protein